MDEAFKVCEAAGILKRTDEQPKYFGAYIFSHMMPAYYGLSADIGAASSDFFKTVVGYDHYNYNWGWRGEDPMYYGIGNITKLDFHRTHLFRAFDVYKEEARRLTMVCSDMNAKVTADFLSVNEWVALRQSDQNRRRRLGFGGSEIVSHHERALEIMKVVPRMNIISAMKHAMMTDPAKETKWEYGMPSEWA